MRRSERGVTIIELLVAVTLLSMLATVLFISLRTGMLAMEKTDKRFTTNRKVLGAQRILNAQLHGIQYAKVQCRQGALGGIGAEGVFFQGEPQSMRFITDFGIQTAHRGPASVVELQVIPGEGGEGVRLIANEIPYAGPRSIERLCNGMAADGSGFMGRLRFVPIVAGGRSFVLADRLESCRFIYQAKRPGTETLVWVPVAPAINELPAAVRVEMVPLKPDPSTLPLLSVTAQIRSERDMTKEYQFVPWTW